MTTARVRQLMQTYEPLGLAMEASIRAAQGAWKARQLQRRPRRGATIRPGALTPLWNELAAAVRGELRRRGEKANLARILGVPRQRVHQYVVAKSAMPDAERTLQLLAWLASVQRTKPAATRGSANGPRR